MNKIYTGILSKLNFAIFSASHSINSSKNRTVIDYICKTQISNFYYLRIYPYQ